MALLDEAATITRERGGGGYVCHKNLSGVQYKEKRSREDQMDRNKEIKIVHDNRLDTDRRDNVNTATQYGKNLQEILDPLAEFRDMWDERSGRIDMTKPTLN